MVLRITIFPPPKTVSNVPSAGDGGGQALGGTPLDITPPEPSGFVRSLLPAVGSPDDIAPFTPAVADDNDMESATVQLARARRGGEAQGFLDQTAKPPAPTAAVVAEAPEDEQNQPASAVSPAPEEPPGFVGSVLRDVARGVVETPLQVVGGMRDALQSTIDLAGWLHEHDPINKLIGVKPIEGHKPELPAVKDAKSTTGGLVRGVAQFLTGFAAGGPVAEGLGAAKLGAGGLAMTKGAIADFTAFHGQDKKLADLVQEHPALKNPVTEFLATKPDDGEAIGRFKRAVEGLGVGVVAEGFVRAVKFLRDAHRASESAKAAGVHLPPGGQLGARQAKALDLLGDENGPLTSLGVPDEVVAKGIAGAAADQRDISARAAAGSPEAAALAELKGMTPLGDGAIAINFARINSADDVKRVLQDAADAFKDGIKAAQRGVQSHEQTRAEASTIDAWNALLARRQGQPLGAAEGLAARNLWEASARKLLDIGEAAARDPSPENLYQVRKMVAIHETIQREVLAARTDIARALDAWKIDARGGRDRLTAIDTLLAAYGGPETAELLARQLAGLKNLPEGLSVAGAMVERGALVKSFAVAKEVYTNALLSSPITHIKVIASNALMQGLDMIERTAAAGWSKFLGSGQVSAHEASAAFFARTQATREAWDLAAKAFIMGQSQFGPRMMQYRDMLWRQEISADNFKLQSGAWRDQRNWLGNGVDALGAIVNAPGRMVGSQDDFFKMIGYRGEVAARAFRRASAEVADGKITREQAADRVAEMMRDPPEDIHQAAVDHARYLNFTAEAGAFVKSINKLETKLAAGGIGGQIGALALRLLLPFRNTPAQITFAALERTPLAPLLSRYRSAIAAGGAEADIARARMALGTMGLMTVLDLALDGHITGGGPHGEEKRGERQTLMRSGWLPYSVKVGDRYFSYNQLDPFGMHLGIAADIAEIINNSEHIDSDRHENITHLAAAAAASFANNVLDKTWMTGLAELVRVLDQSEHAGKFLDNQVASFAGSGARWARRLVDPSVRYTHDMVSEVRNRIPGLSDSLPPARDFWGRVRTYQSGMGTLYDAVMPMQSRLYKPEPIDKEALDNGFNLAMPSMTLTFGKGMNLYLRDHPEFFSRFLDIRGQTKPSDMPGPAIRGPDVLKSLKVHALSGPEILVRKYGDQPLLDLLNDVVSGKNDELSPAYDQASGGAGGGKQDMIKHIVSDYTRAAKGALLYETQALKDKLDRKAAKKAGSGA